MQPEEIDRNDPEWAEPHTLFGAYLHQDFDAVHGDAWSAVRNYAQESTEDERRTSAKALRRLLAMTTETSLKKIVDHFGMAYYPPGDGYSSYRYWLTAVAEHLEDPEAHPGPPERDAPLPDTDGRKSSGQRGRVSTFTDERVANRAVATNLRLNRRAIDAWVKDRTDRTNRAFEYRHSRVVGRLAPPDATLETIHDVDRSRVILRRTTQAAEGWFVMVAYPIAAADPAVAAAIDRTAPEWDALWALLGGYLHQDVDIHGGASEAVAAFVTDATSDQVGDAARAIRRLLDGGDEAYLAAATEWLGMDYHPPGDGRTYRGWLTAVVEQLER